MGKIIGDGITFDDVLLVPSYSEVIPNQVNLTGCSSDQEDSAEHPPDECRHGYGYRAPHGDCNGKTGWNRYYSQEHVDRGAG